LATYGYVRVSSADQNNEALEYAKKSGYVMGEFLIQDCIPKDEESM